MGCRSSQLSCHNSSEIHINRQRLCMLTCQFTKQWFQSRQVPHQTAGVSCWGQQSWYQSMVNQVSLDVRAPAMPRVSPTTDLCCSTGHTHTTSHCELIAYCSCCCNHHLLQSWKQSQHSANCHVNFLHECHSLVASCLPIIAMLNQTFIRSKAAQCTSCAVSAFVLTEAARHYMCSRAVFMTLKCGPWTVCICVWSLCNTASKQAHKQVGTDQIYFSNYN